MHSFVKFVAIGVFAATLIAQRPGFNNGPNTVRTFRATMVGSSSDEGKCTIEVDVDDVAEVEVFGDQGRLVTLAGQPAEWRRMQCNQPLPANPSEFRFKGIDGRGRVTLQADPRQNRGVAVVHIEDSKGGREGYTFDLIWRGGQAYTGNRPVYGQPVTPDPTGNPGYRPDGGQRWETTVIRCESDGGRRRYCDADTSRGALLLRPRGPNECRLGVSWGYDERGIWVDRGCRAEFEVAR